MNLRQIANRLTSAINPNLPATVEISSGYVTSPSGTQTPAYAAPVTIAVQMQALTKPEIEHLESLNISGSTASLYANMQLSGTDRVTQSGGDLVTFGSGPNIPASLQGGKWLVTAVLEGWSTAGWCKVAITRQMPS